MSDTDSSTLMTTGGIAERFGTTRQMAGIIKNRFVCVERLVRAVEEHDDLTELDGVGNRTATLIETWWEDRYAIEQQASAGNLTLGPGGGKIELHNSWEDALTQETDDE